MMRGQTDAEKLHGPDRGNTGTRAGRALTPLRHLLPRSARARLGLALAVAPLLGQFLVVHLLGVNTPVWDEFYYADFIRSVREGGPWLPWLQLQHNEHRVVPMKLVMAPLAVLTGWNTVAEMDVSAVLAGVVILGLWRLYRRTGGRDLLLFAPLPWLVCSLSQYQNMLYGMMMCHYFTVAGVVWALEFLAWRSPAGLLLAILSGSVASFSILNGLLVWPVGLLVLLAREGRARHALVWAGSAVLATGLYFHRFTMPPRSEPWPIAAAAVIDVVRYAVTALGAPLGAGSAAWSLIIGLAMTSLAAILAIRAWRDRERRDPADALPAGLVLFGLFSCAAIAVGRVSVISPIESRYIAYSSLAIAGLYLLVGRRSGAAGAGSDPAWLRVAVLTLLLVGLSAANVHGLEAARQWRAARLQEKFLLQTAESQPDSVLGRVYFVPELRRIVPYMRAARLGPFADPPELLLLVRWAEGLPAGEIRADRPVEQRVVCPVAELWDVAIPFTTSGLSSRSSVALTVSLDDRPLRSRALPVTRNAAGAAWLAVRLTRPLRHCQGRELAVAVTSTDAAAGDAVTVWTYPRYYAGTLRQAGSPAGDERVLGLALNGFHFGILP